MPLTYVCRPVIRGCASNIVIFAGKRRQFHASSPKESSIATTSTIVDTISPFYWLHSIGCSWALAIPLVAIGARCGIHHFLNRRQRACIQSMIDANPIIVMQSRFEMIAKRNKGQRLEKKAVAEIAKKTRARVYRELRIKAWEKWLPLAQLPVFLVVMEHLRSILGYRSGILGAIWKGLGFGKDSEMGPVAQPKTGPAYSEGVLSTEKSETVAGFIPQSTSSELPSLVTGNSTDLALHLEGLVWCRDLTIPDPYYVLPLAVPMAMCGLAIYNGGFLDKSPLKPPGRRERFLVFLPVILTLVTPQLPAGMLWYWLWSTVSAGALTVYDNVYRPFHYPIRKGWKPAETIMQPAARKQPIKRS